MVLKFKIDGLILTNTTNQNRDNLVDPKKNEIGGLSGLPLQKMSLKFIKIFYKINKKKYLLSGLVASIADKALLKKLQLAQRQYNSILEWFTKDLG